MEMHVFHISSNVLNFLYQLFHDPTVKMFISPINTNLVKLNVSMNDISNEVILSCKVDCKLE